MVEVKIYYHDTDSGGVVYYANYLKYLEEARTEFFAEKGLSVRDLAQADTLFVVLRQEIEYRSPAVYGDTLRIDTRISHSTPVRIEFEHEIKKPDGQLVCVAKTLTACVSSALRPKPIPEEVKRRLL
jgi:acyl-CoA thioester hydrolase